MTITCFIILLFIILLIICGTNRSSYTNGGGDCPHGYVVARCMGPNGERICTPLLKEF